MAVALVNHLVAPGRPSVRFDFAAELERLIRLAERPAFGPSTQALIDEAVSRDIPFIRLDRHSLVQLGQGVHQQRIRATMTSQTSAIAVDIASRQEPDQPAARLGRPARAPVARSSTTEDGAVAAARAHRLPVRASSRSTATTAAASTSTCAPTRRSARPSTARWPRAAAATSSSRPTSPATTTAAWSSAARSRRSPSACRPSSSATASTPSASWSTSANPDPRRGIGHEKVLTRIKVDDAAEELVRAQGFELDAVPPDGTRVKLALTGNMSTGGTSIDRTIEAHPDNVEIAETAAQVVGLDVAGHRLHLPRHRDPGARDRRRDRRGQRRARLPDAHPPDRGRAAVRRPAGDRPAVPARLAGRGSRSSP